MNGAHSTLAEAELTPPFVGIVRRTLKYLMTLPMGTFPGFKTYLAIKTATLA